MTLHKKIQLQQIEARKNKIKVVSNLLTTLLGQLETDNLGKKGFDKESIKDLPDSVVLSTIKSFIVSSELILTKRPDDAQALEELVVLKSYLPTFLTKEELDVLVKDFIKNQTELNSFNDYLKVVMPHFKKNYANQYDSKLLLEVLKENV